MPTHYVCIGSSAAGLSAARKLRELDAQARITVLTAETEMPYNRCRLSGYVEGRRGLDQIRTRTADFFTENSIELKLGCPVVAIEPQAQQVRTAQGDSYGYDKLFLGMGKSSFKPNLPGLNAQGVFSFYDLNDSNAILTYIKQNGIKHVTVIGAGVTGLELADALMLRGLSVTIIQRSSRVLSQQLDEQASHFLEKKMHEKGVVLHKNATPDYLETVHNQVIGVAMVDGSIVKTSMVIFAVGGKSNTQLALEAGIVVQGSGIVTNQYLQTNIANIYAGGDVVLVNHLLTNSLVQNSLWSDAGMQGLAAASNMTGNPQVYEGILPITSTQVFGVSLAMSGYDNQLLYKDLIKQTEHMYHRFLLHDGVLKNFMMVGNVSNVGTLRQALLTKQVIQS